MSELSTEPIHGWRLWHVRLHGDEHRLESFTMHHVSWPARSRFEASCPVHRNGAPVDGHECGIYAFRTRALAEELLRRYTGVRHCYGREYKELPPVRQGRPIALGSVSLWGRISFGKEASGPSTPIPTSSSSSAATTKSRTSCAAGTPSTSSASESERAC